MGAEQKDLRLKFTAFDLEESVNCAADYVVIRDGKENTAPLIGNYIKKENTSELRCPGSRCYVLVDSRTRRFKLTILLSAPQDGCWGTVAMDQHPMRGSSHTSEILN